LQAFTNSMMPLIVANPQAVNQLALMHEFATELIGPDEADLLVRVPTPPDRLRSQELENEGLIAGEVMDVDQDDVDEDHMEKMRDLYERAIDKESAMQAEVRRVVIQHYMHHLYQRQRKQAQEKALQARQPAQMLGMPPPEAGGTQAQSPQAGGMSDALNSVGGQTQNENPGPADVRKSPRSGGAGRPMAQAENDL
jgi:hypothetical protein